MAFQAIKLDCSIYFDQKNGLFIGSKGFLMKWFFLLVHWLKQFFLLLVKCDILIKMRKRYTSLIEWDVCIFY